MSSKKEPIRLIGNTVQLIEALAEFGALSPAAAAEHVGIPRSSVYRLIDGLAAVDLVEPVGDGTVRLSTRWLSLSDAARSALVEWRSAPPVLQELVDGTQQTAYLSVLTGATATCIQWRRGRGVDVLALRPARSLPLHAGAAGRMLLASAVDVEAFLANAPFAQLTPETITDAGELRLDVERTRAQDYVWSRGDVTVGIDALGVPVRSARGAVVGCLSLGGLTDAFTARVDAFVGELRAAADALGRAFARPQEP
jgi:IclR family acetate operon transcriptional repressor